MVIYLGLLQPKRYCTPGTFGHRSSKIVLLSLKSVIPIKSSHVRCVQIQLHSIMLSPSAPSPNGALTLPRGNPSSAAGHHYIIVGVDYFTKWEEAMPTYNNNAKIAALFMFNHIIVWFDIPKSIVTDHGTHFCNAMMAELTSMLILDHEHSSPYYPQANGQVESINCILKTMLQQMVGKHKSN